MELSERLQILRKESNYSQEYIAEKLGVSRQALSKWENGQANPDINNIKKISEIYSISTDYILFGKEFTPEVVIPDKKTGEFLYKLPQSLRIALSISIVAITIGVIVPMLFFLVLEIWA